MKISKFLKQFNWRFLLVRILVNAIALAVSAAIVPKVYFVDKSIWNWLLMAIMLGVLNALLKPILQPVGRVSYPAPPQRTGGWGGWWWSSG
jgi:hypothetical protein